jgi:hypothetical protein
VENPDEAPGGANSTPTGGKGVLVRVGSGVSVGVAVMVAGMISSGVGETTGRIQSWHPSNKTEANARQIGSKIHFGEYFKFYLHDY